MKQSNEAQIFQTHDLSIFKTLKGNRPVNPSHLKGLLKSVKENYLPTIIIVNDKMEIIDGQHRNEVCKILNFPIKYIIRPGYGLKEAQALNANSKIWTDKDHISSFATLGKEDYQQLLAFIEKYKFGIKESERLLTGVSTHSGKSGSRSLAKTGEFKVVNLARAEKWAQTILSIEPYYKGVRRRSFFHAMFRLLNQKDKNMTPFKSATFLNKLEKNSLRLQDCVTVEMYIKDIEKIYNYRSKEKARFI